MNAFDRKIDSPRRLKWDHLRQVRADDPARGGQASLPHGVTPAGIDDTALDLVFPGTCRPYPDPVSCEVWVGDHAIDVCAPMHLLQRIVATAGYHQDIAALDPAQRAIVLQWILAPAMDRIEDLLGGSFEVLDASPHDGSAGCDDMLFVDVEGLLPVPAGIGIAMGPAALSRLAAAAREGRRSLLDPATCTLRFLAEGIVMSPEDIATLQVGEGLILPPDWSHDYIASVEIDGRLGAACRASAEGLALAPLAPVSPTPPPHERTTAMKDTTELDIAIGIQVASETLPAARLAALVEGGVLPLPSMSDDGVELIVDGRPIAKGVLVHLDDGFGVQIVEIY